jgi:FkbM family methyltransferase
MSIIKKEIDGFIFNLDTKSPGASADLIVAGSREPEFMWILREEAVGKLGIDLGANLGYTTLNMSRGMQEIVAIEPDKRTRNLLKMNVRENGLAGKIRICSFAVSDKSGSQSIYYTDKPNLTMLCEPSLDKRKLYSKGKIKTKTLDQLGFIPDFIKMDIEGFEVEVLRGGMNTLSSSPNCKLLIEVHPGLYTVERDFSIVLRDLIKLGYKFKYIASAGCAQPTLFKEKGYEPFKIFTLGEYTRGVYKDIQVEDAIYFCSIPHRQFITTTKRYSERIVRSILLSR